MPSGHGWQDCCDWKVLATLVALLITAVKFSKTVVVFLIEIHDWLRLAVHRKMHTDLCPCVNTIANSCLDCEQVDIGIIMYLQYNHPISDMQS